MNVEALQREDISRTRRYPMEAFDPAVYLATPGPGRKTVRLQAKETFFLQGTLADSVFYIQTGTAKLTVVSGSGKEAAITLLGTKDFAGEEALASVRRSHSATATALTPCTVLKIEREALLRVMQEQQALSDLFLAFLLRRSMRTQADLADQLLNNSEKRLARVLLIMAGFGRASEPETLIPPVTQETLAAMIGTTRSRVNFFMNRFRQHGFIEYRGRIRVRKSLSNVLLHEEADGSSEISAGASEYGLLCKTQNTNRYGAASSL